MDWASVRSTGKPFRIHASQVNRKSAKCSTGNRHIQPNLIYAGQLELSPAPNERVAFNSVPFDRSSNRNCNRIEFKFGSKPGAPEALRFDTFGAVSFAFFSQIVNQLHTNFRLIFLHFQFSASSSRNFSLKFNSCTGGSKNKRFANFFDIP